MKLENYIFIVLLVLYCCENGLKSKVKCQSSFLIQVTGCFELCSLRGVQAKVARVGVSCVSEVAKFG